MSRTLLATRPITPAPLHHPHSTSANTMDKYRVGDIVYIHKAACQRLPWKELGPGRIDDSLFIGPFKVVGRVGPQQYKLDLPRGCRVKNCFEERVLKRAEPQRKSKKQAPQGQAYQMDRAHEIVKLVEARNGLLRPRYLAQWKGCDPHDTTFITENVLLQLPKERRRQLLKDLEK